MDKFEQLAANDWHALVDAKSWYEKYRHYEATLQIEQPELWGYLNKVRGPSGERHVTRMPRPGDIIRTNSTDTELRVIRAFEQYGAHCFETRTLDRNALHCLYGYRLENGRLLGSFWPAGTAGNNIYNLGQDEIFVLRRAYQVLPHGRKAVMQSIPDMFA